MNGTGLPKATSRLPAKFGRYRIVDRIGYGAMGVVYSARDDIMDRTVAIKVMMADLEGEPDTRERFFREARVAGQLLHTNIITVFDLGEEDGRLYIVMELLQGEVLSQFLAKPQAPSLETKIDLILQVYAGLSQAHARQVFHRDIKPGNLFVQRDGTLKILDFGIARLASSSMTASGFIVGTPDFMSPEQARGEEVDARSDVFSAAAVFYMMLAGRKPFAAADLPAVLHRVEAEDPAPLDPETIPPRLGAIVMKALAKRREDRYQSCGAASSPRTAA
jgi:eukaryotic-like serine/threonine-protein kinase